MKLKKLKLKINKNRKTAKLLKRVKSKVIKNGQKL